MKVTCDFLPREYKAYHLDKQVLTVSVVAWAVSIALFAWLSFSLTREVAGLKSKVTSVEADLQRVREDRRSQLYPQERIRELKSKFEFIKQAMGAKDFPYLRFYQTLEDSVPADDGQRKAYIKSLRREGNQITLEGEARGWRDAREFEKRLSVSEVGPAGSRRKNYSDVRLLSCNAIQGGKGYTFTITANFEADI